MILLDEKDYLSVEGVAYKMDVTTKTVYELIRSGKLKAYKFGEQWRISKLDLQVYLEERSNCEGTESDTEN